MPKQSEKTNQNTMRDFDRNLAGYIKANYTALEKRINEGRKTPTTPSTKQVFAMAAQALARVITLAVISRDKWDPDAEALDLFRWFNPIKATWDNPKYILTLVLDSTIQTYTNNDLVKLANYMFGLLRNRDVPEVPAEYNGSRWLVFNNGLCDVKTGNLYTIPLQRVKVGKFSIPIVPADATIEINDTPVPLPQVGFTERQNHNIDYIKGAEVPAYAPSGKENKSWTPKRWLQLLTGENEQYYNYALFILGMMLVPAHSFDCFIEIKGDQGSGKTTLIDVAQRIYGDNHPGIISNARITELNDPFPFRGRVNQNTVLVHMTEANGSYLNDKAIAMLNSFANRRMLMTILGEKSATLTPPPLAVLEGTAWVGFDNTKSGIARRLLPLDLTGGSARDYRAKGGKETTFKRRQVLQWFLSEAIRAYGEVTKGAEDYKLELDAIERMPLFVQRWHQMAVNAGDDKMNNYMERISPLLHTGFLPGRLMYDLYKKSVEMDADEDLKVHHRGQRSFTDALIIYLKERFDVQLLKGTARHSEDQLGIDLSQINDVMPVDETRNGKNNDKDLTNYNQSNYNQFKVPNWLYIEEKEEPF